MITVLHKIKIEDITFRASAGQPSSNQRLADMALAPMASTPRRLPPEYGSAAAVAHRRFPRELDVPFSTWNSKGKTSARKHGDHGCSLHDAVPRAVCCRQPGVCRNQSGACRHHFRDRSRELSWPLWRVLVDARGDRPPPRAVQRCATPVPSHATSHHNAWTAIACVCPCPQVTNVSESVSLKQMLTELGKQKGSFDTRHIGTRGRALVANPTAGH